MTIFKNTMVYVGIGFLPVAANFLLAPVYTEFLNPEQYALIGLATLFQTFLTFFLSLSLDSAFSRIYFQFEKKYKLKYAYLSTLLLTVIIISIFVFVLLLFFGDWLFSIAFNNPGFRFSNFGYWVVIITFSNIIFIFFAILYRNEENIRKFVISTLLFFAIPVVGTLLGLFYKEDEALGAVIGRSIGSFLFIAVLLFSFFIKNPPILKRSYIRMALKFSLPIIPYQLMFAAFSNIDRIVLERNFTPHDFGVYNLAIMITGVIPVFLNALGNATTPRTLRLLSDGKDVENVKRINYFSLFVSTAVICICIAGVVPAMRLLINKEYSDSYIYIGLLFMSFIFYLHYLVFNMALFFFHKTKVFPVIAFFALLTGILFNVAFLDDLGIWAVCLSLYVIRLVQSLVAYIFIKYYQYDSLIYVKHSNALISSTIIITVYSIFLYWHVRFNFISIEVINFTPIVIFIFIAPFFYKKEVSLIWENTFNKVLKGSN